MSLAEKKSDLEDNIRDAFQKVVTQAGGDLTDASKNIIDQIAKDLTKAIHSYVKSAEVVVDVSTTGTASAQSGKGTGNLV